MIELRACIDVDDLDRALVFYRDAIGLTPGRRLGSGWQEMLGAQTPIDLLANPAGSACCAGAEDTGRRDYRRHWTPVHLDFVVGDMETAITRVRAGGGTLDREIQERPWGRMANIADPFGNGFCLLEFRGRGYDAMFEAEAAPASA
jgi:predicted enzyme related to lactoylglutathione lyase